MESCIFVFNIENARALNEEFCLRRFPERYKRAGRYRLEADRLRSIAAGYLLSEALGVEEYELAADEGGKPRAPGRAEFSLSHSGSYAVLAASEAAIGVDIEQIAPSPPDVGSAVFTAEEAAWVEERPERRFWALWTLKEAASKAVGKGLGINFRSFGVLPLLNGESIVLEGTRLYGKVWLTEKYALSAVSARRSSYVFKRCVPFDETMQNITPSEL